MTDGMLMFGILPSSFCRAAGRKTIVYSAELLADPRLTTCQVTHQDDHGGPHGARPFSNLVWGIICTCTA